MTRRAWLARRPKDEYCYPQGEGASVGCVSGETVGSEGAEGVKGGRPSRVAVKRGARNVKLDTRMFGILAR